MADSRFLKRGVLVTCTHAKHMQMFASHAHFGLPKATLYDTECKWPNPRLHLAFLLALKSCVGPQAQEQMTVRKESA